MIKKFMARPILAVLLCGGLLFPLPTYPAENAVVYKDDRWAQPILEMKVTIEEPEIEIGRLLEQLASKLNVSIVCDPRGLERVGITKDQLVQHNLKDISLKSAMRLMLDHLNLACVPRNEVLVITSLDCPDSEATVRTFEIPVELQKTPVDDLHGAVLDLWIKALPAKTLSSTPPELESCVMRVSMLKQRLVVRGSPRHHQQVEDFIELFRSNPKVALPK